jgi:hypothetical protein
MIQFLSEIIPSLVRLNERLDNTTILKSKDWIQVLEDPKNRGYLNSSLKISYNFRENPNTLRITENGITRRSSWEYLGDNKVELEIEGTYYKFIHKFHDNNKLALMLDGSDKYILLISETEYQSLLNNQFRINQYIESNISSHTNSQISPTLNISISENESFDINNFSSFLEEINKLKITLEQFPINKHVDIITSFAKNHSFKTSWINENPSLCEGLKEGLIDIRIMEQLFKVCKDNSTFQSELIAFIREKLD